MTVQFDRNAADFSGNRRDGTLFGPVPAANRNGNADGAYSFDGIDDYIEIPYCAEMQPPVVTLALWAQRDSWAPASFSDDAAIAGNTDSGGYEFYVDLAAGELLAYVRSRSGAYATLAVALADLAPGWHHFALTCDGVNAILYVDGMPVASDSSGDGSSTTPGTTASSSARKRPPAVSPRETTSRAGSTTCGSTKGCSGPTKSVCLRASTARFR